MKRIKPYLKHLLAVKWLFLLGILCGVLFGIASGFGLPFMVSRVFPIIFSTQDNPTRLYTQSTSGDYVALGETHSVKLSDAIVYQNEDGQTQPLPEDWTLLTGEEPRIAEHDIPLESLFTRDEQGALQPLKASLFIKNKDGKFVPMAHHFKPPNTWVLLGAVSILPLTFFIRGVSGFFNTYLIHLCGARVLEGIRVDVFAKMQELPLRFYQHNTVGDLMSRVVSDTAKLQGVITFVTNDIIKQPMTMIGAISVLIALSWQQQELFFILMLLAAIPICVFPIRNIGKRLAEKAKIQQAQTGKITTVLNEHLSSVKEVRSFNLQERELERFQTHVAKLLRNTMKIVKYNQLLPPMIEVITVTGVSAAIFYASRKGVTVEQIVPIIFALYMAYEPIKKIGNINNRIREGMASLERLEYILNTPVEIEDPASPVPFKNIKGTIRFDHVGFAYDNEKVINDIDLNIQAGETVALVGPSGAGKSTLANLTLRLYEASQGGVFIDGINVRDVRQHDLRQAIAIVSQDPVLFNDTIANNIRCGNTEATLEDVIQAAKFAHADDFINHMEHGYETMTGERGTRLSGGQKQRIAIARAFLKKAPILILDEATSALDSESEVQIQSALEKLIEGKTVIIIAHRFSTLKLANRIILLNQGSIEAHGPHDRLYQENALYKKLCDHQM